MRSMSASKTLELNPRHPIIVALKDLVEASPDEQDTKDAAMLVFDTALLSSGFLQDDLDEFTQRMYRSVGKSLSVDSFDLVDEIELEEEEEEPEEESLTTGMSRFFLSPEPLCFPRFRLLPELRRPPDWGVARRGVDCQSASFRPRGVAPGDTFWEGAACGGVAPEKSRSGVSTVLGRAIRYPPIQLRFSTFQETKHMRSHVSTLDYY